MENLENKVEKIKFPQWPDWKQWIPVAGMYFVARDAYKRRPSLIDANPPVRRLCGIVYHQIFSVYPAYLGICEFLEKWF